MSMCDYNIQFYNAEEAMIHRLDAPDNPCVRVRDTQALRQRHGITLLKRIGSCHAAAIDPNPIVKGGFSLMIRADSHVGPQTPISETQRCEEVQASLMQDVPSDRAFQEFKVHPTKKNHCDFLLEVSATEQAIIDRFERASAHCDVLDGLKTQHAKTLGTQMKVCDAAAVDPDDLVIHP